MEGLKGYLLSITVAAIICSIIKSVLPGKSKYSGILKLLTGLFLTVTVLSPLVKFEFGEISGYIDHLSMDGKAAAQAGEWMAREEAAQLIKKQLETYILDKANSLKLDMKVEIVLNEAGDLRPSQVRLKGAVSPYAKEVLSRYIANDLGIPEEQQKWS